MDIENGLCIKCFMCLHSGEYHELDDDITEKISNYIEYYIADGKMTYICHDRYDGYQMNIKFPYIFDTKRHSYYETIPLYPIIEYHNISTNETDIYQFEVEINNADFMLLYDARLYDNKIFVDNIKIKCDDLYVPYNAYDGNGKVLLSRIIDSTSVEIGLLIYNVLNDRKFISIIVECTTPLDEFIRINGRGVIDMNANIRVNGMSDDIIEYDVPITLTKCDYMNMIRSIDVCCNAYDYDIYGTRFRLEYSYIGGEDHVVWYSPCDRSDDNTKLILASIITHIAKPSAKMENEYKNKILSERDINYTKFELRNFSHDMQMLSDMIDNPCYIIVDVVAHIGVNLILLKVPIYSPYLHKLHNDIIK